MADLEHRQTSFMEAIVFGSSYHAAELGPTRRGLAAQAALEIHRATVFGGLASALGLIFPTVKARLGQERFSIIAERFIAANLPTDARLNLYGAGFPAFLAEASEEEALVDLARFDQAIDTALNGPDEAERRTIAIDTGVSLSLPVSLSVLMLSSAADDMRSDPPVRPVVSDERTGNPASFCFALWRRGPVVVTRRVSRVAASFLKALLEIGDPAAALVAAEALEDQATALSAIQAEVFAAPFAHIVSHKDCAP